MRTGSPKKKKEPNLNERESDVVIISKGKSKAKEPSVFQGPQAKQLQYDDVTTHVRLNFIMSLKYK